ncbi:MAG TPA: hypothetical protein VFS77_06830, partial [Pyrinomonadaceae bacterium]|nr:hypothetical protein [Pyrinomonadaceae bacterium]
MKRINLVLICVLFSVVAVMGQPKRQEQLIRETYTKLESYNAAAQALENEFAHKAFRVEGSLRFELGDFRSGPIDEIRSQAYAGLVTLPTGDVIALTRGSHVQDDGPEEATFGAAWERGQYAAVFDPEWTVADVFHFEPEKYYDVVAYTSYQVTVRLEGRARTYRALALFRDASGSPEFWDAIVNGVTRVWQEKRPPYKTRVADTSSLASDGTMLSSVSVSTSSISVPLKFWFNKDIG